MTGRLAPRRARGVLLQGGATPRSLRRAARTGSFAACRRARSCPFAERCRARLRRTSTMRVARAAGLQSSSRGAIRQRKHPLGGGSGHRPRTRHRRPLRRKGRSRMGRPKAWLPFRRRAALARVVRRGQASGLPRRRVAAPDQDLPPLPETVTRSSATPSPVAARSGHPRRSHGHGGTAPPRYPVFVSSWTLPSSTPRSSAARRTLRSGGDHRRAVARAQGHFHPLAAVYRTLPPRARGRPARPGSPAARTTSSSAAAPASPTGPTSSPGRPSAKRIPASCPSATSTPPKTTPQPSATPATENHGTPHVREPSSGARRPPPSPDCPPLQVVFAVRLGESRRIRRGKDRALGPRSTGVSP